MLTKYIPSWAVHAIARSQRLMYLGTNFDARRSSATRKASNLRPGDAEARNGSSSANGTLFNVWKRR